MPVKDYLKKREGMHDKFDRRLGIIGVALVFENIKKDGEAWGEIDPILDKLLRDNAVWEEAPFLWVGLAYRYGIKNDLVIEKRPYIDKKWGSLDVGVQLDTHILEWADKNSYSLLRDIFLVAALNVFVQVCKKYKLDDKISCLEKELRKYHPIPNSIDEAIRYAAQGLRL
tara:strand:- start:1421 stop:1930 length:510 start_codon:yes stop_codon:yes gene_type:complete